MGREKHGFVVPLITYPDDTVTDRAPQPGLKLNIYIYIKDLINSFVFRLRGKEKEREKQQCVVASRVPPTGNLARNPGMCPDWEQNQRPFGSQAGAQSTEPHQPGLKLYF